MHNPKSDNKLKKIGHKALQAQHMLGTLDIETPIALIDKSLIYFILTTTEEEFQTYFLDFYSIFDENRDL